MMNYLVSEKNNNMKPGGRLQSTVLIQADKFVKFIEGA